MKDLDKKQVETVVWIGAYALAMAAITHRTAAPATVSDAVVEKMDANARAIADRATKTITEKLDQLEATPK